MTAIHITDIEAAINHWRTQQPAPVGQRLAPPLQALAELYAAMVFQGRHEIEEAELAAPAASAWLSWYATTPDTPCIAICSTSQGDDCCKGCGRSFAEIQHWPVLSPAAKRSTWRRITAQGQAWRFNRYAERAGPAPG